MVYKGSVAFSAGCRSGYSDGARSVEIMLESLSGGRRREIHEDGIVMEVKKNLFKCSRRSWRETNWVRLSATS